jgi:hypothetical protein
MVFEWIPQEPLHCFIHLQFVQNRDYVTLNAQWSRLGRFPPEVTRARLRIGSREYRMGAPDVEGQRDELLKSSNEAWLNATDFGRESNTFEMSNPIPPISRLKDAFETSEGKQLLLDGDIADWRRFSTYHTWGIVGTFVKLNEADAQHALGGTVAELCSFARDVYLPYLRRVVSILFRQKGTSGGEGFKPA